jgi:hypothetical protein
VSITHPALSSLLHPEAFLQRHPDESFVRNAIILMFVSRVGILSTEIESAIPLRLTTHPVSVVSHKKPLQTPQKTINSLKNMTIAFLIL